jgi:hypothetical protein
MEGDFCMTGLVWAPLSGNVFDTVSGTFTFSDDDVRAVYIDWGDGVSNKKSEANYQWKQLTEPKSSIEVGHTYTASSSATGYNPVIQTMNSKGFFSKYYTYGAVAGTIGTNTDITPSVDDTGIGRIIIYDGQATGIMRVENKTVKSGIDNSIFDKEGPKQLYLMVPPLCTAAELLTIDNITIEIKAVVDYSLIATGTDTTVVGGAGRGDHKIKLFRTFFIKNRIIYPRFNCLVLYSHYACSLTIIYDNSTYSCIIHRRSNICISSYSTGNCPICIIFREESL